LQQAEARRSGVGGWLWLGTQAALGQTPERCSPAAAATATSVGIAHCSPNCHRPLPLPRPLPAGFSEPACLHSGFWDLMHTVDSAGLGAAKALAAEAMQEGRPFAITVAGGWAGRVGGQGMGDVRCCGAASGGW
jgi:hypothetical protein